MESFCYRHSPSYENDCPTCCWAKEENYNMLVERYNRERCGGNIPQGGMGYYGAKPVARSNGKTDFERWLNQASQTQQQWDYMHNQPMSQTMRDQQAQQQAAQAVSQLQGLVNGNGLVGGGSIVSAWDVGSICVSDGSVSLNPVPPPPTCLAETKSSNKLLLLINQE